MTAQEAIDLIRSGRLGVFAVPRAAEPDQTLEAGQPDLVFHSPETREQLTDVDFYQLLLPTAEANLALAQEEVAEMADRLRDPIPRVKFGDLHGWFNAYAALGVVRRFPAVNFSPPLIAVATPEERRAICAHEVVHLHHGDGVLTDTYADWGDTVVDRLVELPLIEKAHYAYRRRTETRADVGAMVRLGIPVGDMISMLRLFDLYDDPRRLVPTHPTFRARIRSLAAAHLRPVLPSSLPPAKVLKRVDSRETTL